MKKLKIYLDTSAIGYLDEQPSQKEMEEMFELWKLLKCSEYEVIISQIVVDELMANCNLTKRDILFEYLKLINHNVVDLIGVTQLPFSSEKTKYNKYT